MRKNIFEIENRLNIQKEFEKFVQVFHSSSLLIDSYSHITFIDYIDREYFKFWEYRGTSLSILEYLENIGIGKHILSFVIPISEELFLRYMEFLLNIINISIAKMNFGKTDKLLLATILNIPFILEKLNYNEEKIRDKTIITKRDADVDSVLTMVPKDISILLLEYNDFGNTNNIETKKSILKDIDLYIEKDKLIFKKIVDNTLLDSIGTIVNKMGVNHPINEEPYKSFTNGQLIEWYDKCFLMMIHAIRSVEVNKIKNERLELVKK
ncbi:MAG: hypothetical protein PHG84_05040 [Endomicrobiaceae bacterium]|nr:hypothetical protein [Endomicrobiaceae bacterium]MDD3922535.1 hypothetical protein [Endomicrobiaceae bacterium]